MTYKDEIAFKRVVICHICDKNLDEILVRDYTIQYNTIAVFFYSALDDL